MSNSEQVTPDEKKKKKEFPHSNVIIFGLIVLMAVLTWIIPAGTYQRHAITMPDGGSRTVVDPDSFTVAESNPSKPFDIFKAFPTGLAEAQSIVFFIFLVGGSFAIINDTGAIEAGITKVTLALKGKEKLLIPLIVFIFSLGGTTIGMAEECIVFIPIGIALARAVGYDAIVGMGMVSLGAAAGFTSGLMNPFTLGVAQGIAELPYMSGWELRIIVMICTLILVIWYLTRYANKVKNDPTKSIVYALEQEEKDQVIDLSNVKKMTTRHMLVLISFGLGMCLLVFGVFKYGWYITEIAACFLAMGILGGILGGMSANDISKSFVTGAKDVTAGALVVGLARGLLVIMADAGILDTIVHGLAQVISSLPRAVSAIGMLLVQSLLNFIIPSGSGLAATTMPIMSPLSDVVGITRQTAVLAYQFGDGITNSLVPTSGVLLANLTLAKIKYEDWFKFIWPLMAIWTAMGAVFMIIATMINYGPF